jgi:hypothetical protein
MRKRSNYRPKGVIMDTVSHVLGGFRLIKDTAGVAVTLKIKNHDALNNMVQGSGSRKDIEILIAAMNVAEAMAVKCDLGSEYGADITAAQDALVTMGRRGLSKDGRFLFTGPELTAMNLGMEVHDAQLEVCTISQMERALNFVEQEIKGRRARAIA